MKSGAILRQSRWIWVAVFVIVVVLFSPTAIRADFADDVQNMSSSKSTRTSTTTPRVVDHVDEIMAGGTLAGSSLLPFIKRLLIPKEEFRALKETISKGVHWEDMVTMTVIGWLTVPTVQWPYQKLLPDLIKPKVPFRSTVMYVLANHLQQIARIALLVYFVDIFKMLCIGMGFDFCKMSKFPHAFAQIA